MRIRFSVSLSRSLNKLNVSTSAHLFLLSCFKFKLLLSLWFVLFSTISLHVRKVGGEEGNRSIVGPWQPPLRYYTHTHTHCFK